MCPQPVCSLLAFLLFFSIALFFCFFCGDIVCSSLSRRSSRADYSIEYEVEYCTYISTRASSVFLIQLFAHQAAFLFLSKTGYYQTCCFCRAELHRAWVLCLAWQRLISKGKEKTQVNNKTVVGFPIPLWSKGSRCSLIVKPAHKVFSNKKAWTKQHLLRGSLGNSGAWCCAVPRVLLTPACVSRYFRSHQIRHGRSHRKERPRTHTPFFLFFFLFFLFLSFFLSLCFSLFFA